MVGLLIFVFGHCSEQYLVGDIVVVLCILFIFSSCGNDRTLRGSQKPTET